MRNGGSKELTNIFYILICGLFFAVVPTGSVRAETFEFLTYAPPAGWTKEVSADKTVYRRRSGVGAIVFYAGYPSNRPAADEFREMWRKRLEATVPGAAPPPEIQRDGDYTAAVGMRVVNAQGTLTTIVLSAFIGRGRAVGVLTMSAGDDVFAEVKTFFDGLSVNPGASVPSTDSGRPSAGEPNLEYKVPAGYTTERDGRLIVLSPPKMDEKTPCAYVVGPPRASSGKLETDARTALPEILPGWRPKSEHYTALRGVSGDGWEYFVFQTDMVGNVDGREQSLTAMAIALQTDSGQVSIAWGFGNAAYCSIHRIAFAGFFHGLRPRGWPSDGGRAMSRELNGLWRLTTDYGLAQYKFTADGGYQYGMSAVTSYGLPNTTYSNVRDGRYELREGQLILKPEGKGGATERYRVRIYDEYLSGTWQRYLSLYDEKNDPANDVQYARIED
jgi:hypothetical protein